MPATPNVAISGSLDPVSWRNLQRDLKALAPEAHKQLQGEIKDVAGNIVQAAKANASWSTRIPGSIGLSVTSTRVGVKANRRKAPHARAFEGIGNQGVFGTKTWFRHPVFGRRGTWVNQQTRPFMAPAIRANQDEFFDKAAEAVTTAAKAVGWR